MNTLIILLGAGLVTVLVALLWWLLVTTEGVYLGRRVVIGLYDLYAARYDDIKQFNPQYDHIFLAAPIMGMLAPHQSPLILDVATGTGRLPDAMFNHTYFHGRVFATDLSRRMLEQAAEKLHDDLERMALLWCPAEQLPFDDGAFDVVTCLEALEFMPDPAQVLGELVRVLRPGGLLLITNRVGRHMMPGKTFTRSELRRMLADHQVEDVEIELWQRDYHRVWGMKDGDSPVTGARPLIEVLRCPVCGGHFEVVNDDVWRCATCSAEITIGDDWIVNLAPLYGNGVTR
ncbi:MAG: hypothetical protein OHK0046_05200 [Anaerolineae bacterium]